MPVSPPWQTWRLAIVPATEHVVGRSATFAARRRPIPLRRPNPFLATIVRSLASTNWLAKAVTVEHGLSTAQEDQKSIHVAKEVRARKEEVDQLASNPYPRYEREEIPRKTLEKYHTEFTHLLPGKQHESKEAVQVEGRVQSTRKVGKKLAFIDIADGQGVKLQVLLNFGPLERPDLPYSEFTRCLRLLRRGDVISVKGHPHRTETGELSIKAMQLPTMLSPCLHHFPSKEIEEDAGQEMDKHIVMLSSPESVQLLQTRAEIIRTIRQFFEKREFTEVQTPILAAAAGGAVARPFETVATEFSERKLNLRIAPELWLKRLIIGGMSKIFEIGPSFRNEGLDRTHNPEFTTCEFYQTYTALPQLLETTQSLLSSIAANVINRVGEESLHATLIHQINADITDSITYFQGPYAQLDFIPALNARLNITLPNLASPTARSDLLAIFSEKNIPIPPSNPSLPRLLDRLSSSFLEPECQAPTWITNIPECLSPLSKSFIHPTAPNAQPVAARAELFVQGRELVNCYEEENSPWEQRRKFVMQLEYAHTSTHSAEGDEVAEAKSDAGDPANLDTDYLRALEWGLPPTGGWGCGIDRLVMLFTGKERIGDVLSFGNLRRVTRGAEKWDVTREAESDGDGRRAAENDGS